MGKGYKKFNNLNEIMSITITTGLPLPIKLKHWTWHVVVNWKGELDLSLRKIINHQ